MVWRFLMPETFLDSFIRTTSDGKLQKLVVDNMDEFNRILALYDEFKLMHRFFDYGDEDFLSDPPGCFQC